MKWLMLNMRNNAYIFFYKDNLCKVTPNTVLYPKYLVLLQHAANHCMWDQGLFGKKHSNSDL